MNNQLTDWSLVRVFLAVYRSGSTLAASKILGIAQPTVARKLDALEHALNTTLFERDTRGANPTESARRLLAKAEELEAAADAFANEAASLLRARPIRVTAFTTNLSGQVSDIFTTYALDHPGIEFQFIPSANFVDILGGEADIGMRLTSTPPEDELICRHVSTAEFGVYASKDYIKRHGAPRSVEDLKDHAIINMEVGQHHMISKWIMTHADPKRVVVTTAEHTIAHATIKAGRGVGVENLRMARSYADLELCFGPIPELAMPHMILVNPDAYRRAEVKAFVKYFAPRYAALFRD